MSKKTSGRIPWEAAAFAAALLAVAYLGGMVTARFNLAPYRMLNEAKAALNAELNMEEDTFPANIEDWQDRPTYPLQRTLAKDSGREPLLMVGNFYSRMDLCPRFGCLAWVMDREGKVLHTWPAPDPQVFFKDAKGFSGRVKPTNFYVIGLDYDRDDGDIVVTFHGRNMYPYQVGMAKFDLAGRTLWKAFDNSHHWPTVGSDGLIYVPYVKIGKPGTLAGTATQIDCSIGKVYLEGVRVRGPDGKILKEFGIAEAIARADFPGLAYAVKDGCDPFHVNGIAVVTQNGAERLNVLQGALPKIEPGDLLVSVREESALMILDKDDGTAKRVINGRSSGQHSPHFLPDGRIAVFDNMGGDADDGGSRVLAIDPATRIATQIYPAPGDASTAKLSSLTSGAIMPSPDGSRILVSESKRGRLIEIDAKTGQPLWSYDNIMDFSPYLKTHDLKRKDGVYGRLPTNGAFYLIDPPFLRTLRSPSSVADDHAFPTAG